MVKWRWKRGYEGIAACDDNWKDTRKSLHIGILGDIFISADNCRLLIIVEGTLHVSPAKHSYAWLPRKCDYHDYQESVTTRQTHGQTDAGQSDPYVPLCFAGDTKRLYCIIIAKWFSLGVSTMITMIHIHSNYKMYFGVGDTYKCSMKIE